MSRTFLLAGLVIMLPLNSAYAGPIGSTPRSVFVPNLQTPATPVCPPRYNPEHTRYYSRPYCPDVGDYSQQFIVGQIIPLGFGQAIGFAQLTPALRVEYRFDPESDYVLANGFLYDVDHGTRTIRQVIPVSIQR